MNTPGALMAREAAQSATVFASTAAQDVSAQIAPLELHTKRAWYTVARGSSDAAATILSYEMMRALDRPVTTLPPSVFSLGHGVDLSDAATLIISQSGASTDLAMTVAQAQKRGAATLALTNKTGSPVERAAQATLHMKAGEELAIPATKSVVASIACGLSLIAGLKPSYRADLAQSAQMISGLRDTHPKAKDLTAALLRSQHVYVIGRDCGFGAAQEVALKLKECCALHAEAYSSSEVLHGPLQLVTKPIFVLILDIESPATQPSLDIAESRLRAVGGDVMRLRPSDIGAQDLLPAAAAAALLHVLYPVILAVSLALGHDPDRPETLAKETLTT